MDLVIPTNPTYAETNIAIIGLTNSYGSPSYVLITSDKEEKLKFPGGRFMAPKNGKSLEDIAQEKFELQTGLPIEHMLGLRAIIPSRCRNTGQWLFRNVFLAVIGDIGKRKKTDIDRRVYLAEVGRGAHLHTQDYVFELGNSSHTVPVEWVKDDNRIIARMATQILSNEFDWKTPSSDWYRKIPCPIVNEPKKPAQRMIMSNLPQSLPTVDNSPAGKIYDGPGCGLAVASMMVLYQPSPMESRQIILLKRKADKFPGYAGGKIETPLSSESANIDPISCCMEEGAQEYGFEIVPRALICCTATPLTMPVGGSHYNCIWTYAFMAEPRNPLKVKEALANPSAHLESKMEAYVVEGLKPHMDRILNGELRMPDMIAVGKEFYKTPPGQKINLMQIVSSGEM